MTDAALPTALIVVDVQHAFVDHDPPPHDVTGLLVALRTLSATARAVGALVVHVQDVGADDPRFAVGERRGLVLDIRPGSPW